MAKIIALIPARGGSKGIPQKNIVNIAGKPLLSHTIHAARIAQVFDNIYVSSDDDQILSVAEQEGAAIIRRYPEFAQVLQKIHVIKNTLMIVVARMDSNMYLLSDANL